MATLTGIPSVRAVTSSWAVIWKQPSPSMHQTVRSGRPTLAPMAAGTPKPMVPAPPELIQVPGSSKCQNCAAHIWCWPTPEVTIVPGRRGLRDRGDDVLGPQRALGAVARRRRAGSARATRPGCAHHASRSRGDRARAASRARSAVATSLWIATSGRRTLPNSARSMSTWMTLADGRERRDLAGHAVVEARAEADQQVAALDRGDRRVDAVHPGHAQVLVGGCRGTRRGPSAWSRPASRCARRRSAAPSRRAT